MAREKHTDDLRNVNEGDSVTLETHLGQTFEEVECVTRTTERADPRSGEIRQSKIWQFETPVGTVVANILDGLRSSEDDPDFPQHSKLWNLDEEEGLGYIASVEILGPRKEA